MHSTKEWNCLKATWLVILLAFIARVLLAGQFQLAPDEANYWQWSRYLDLGYHDHPPLIAWTIRLATSLFGQVEFAVRLPTILAGAIGSIYLSLLAGRWFSYRCGFHVALLSQVVLLFNGCALIATPDGLLLACWAGAMYHASRAMERNRILPWLLTGFWFGMGLLAKYTMLLFLPSLFLAMLVVREYRNHLTTGAPWAGLILGLIVFSPVVYWNSRHEWATFRHVLFQGGIDDSTLFTFRYIGDFLGSQILLLSPVVFFLIVFAWIFSKGTARVRKQDVSFLKAMSLTGFLIFFLLAFHVRIYGNWPAPVYLAALVLIAALYSPGRSTLDGGSYFWWKTGVVTAGLMTLPVLVQVVWPVLPIPLHLDRTAREVNGWKELAAIVDTRLQAMPHPEKTFVFGLTYQYASELAFYMPGQPRTVSINRWTRPNVYDFWFSDDMLLGQDGVGVYSYKGMDRHLATLFDRVEPAEEIRLYRISGWYGKQLIRTLYLVRCYGFRGGLRWLPERKDDIRATREQTGS